MSDRTLKGSNLQPVFLPSNQPRDRFYRGGQQISQLRGEVASDAFSPEDWVGSTTTLRGSPLIGLTRLEDGELLRDAVAHDPQMWLGPRHVERYGQDTMLLVKLLDAGQRLPVHAHPDGGFARRYLGATHGKAEAWFVLTPGTVHVGLKRDVSLLRLKQIVAEQDTATLLSLLHTIDVEPGDSVFVPTGVLHAVGEGILLAEVQEPEDLSILIEWSGFDLDGKNDGHLGLGFDVALTAVERRGLRREDLNALIRRAAPEGNVLAQGSEQYFRLDLVAGPRQFRPGLAIVIALDDGVRFQPEITMSHTLARGSTLLVPFCAGGFLLRGNALVARPPK